jgi:putative addiction module component (TIGR02574 family)
MNLSSRTGQSTMALSLSEIEQLARALTAEERAKLAETLLESLQENYVDIEVAWQNEIAERAAAYERGDLTTYAAEDVFAEANRLVK